MKPIKIVITFYKEKLRVKFDESLIKDGNLHLKTKYGKIVLAGEGYLFALNPPNAWFPLGTEELSVDDIEYYFNRIKDYIPDLKIKQNKDNTKCTIVLDNYYKQV